MDLTREQVETVFAVLTGIGLSAACGFRIFCPFALNLASMYGLVGLAPGFEWIAGCTRYQMARIATVLETLPITFPGLTTSWTPSPRESVIGMIRDGIAHNGHPLR